MARKSRRPSNASPRWQGAEVSVARAGVGGEVFLELSGFLLVLARILGVSFFTVMFGHCDEYSRLSSSHCSRPGSVSDLMASTGHSGSQTPQSMHSSGLITSMVSPL